MPAAPPSTPAPARHPPRAATLARRLPTAARLARNLQCQRPPPRTHSRAYQPPTVLFDDLRRPFSSTNVDGLSCVKKLGQLLVVQRATRFARRPSAT